MSSRPKIGVTTARHGGLWMWNFNRFCLWRAGAKAIRIKPGEELDVSILDGLLVGGGDDIGVDLYHSHLEPAVTVDPERDRLELDLVQHALLHEMPVLGVCRGAQMINVAMGGTLHGDIHTVFHGVPKMRTVLPRKSVTVHENSRLSGLLGVAAMRVNALHHQAIDRLGDGIIDVAWDGHGIVQAIESKARACFCFGVQWHPEFLILDRGQMALFSALADAAAKFRRPGMHGTA